jgi:hypothetical protein
MPEPYSFDYSGAGGPSTGMTMDELLRQNRVNLPEATPIEATPTQLPYPSGELEDGGGNAPYVPPGVLPPGNQPTTDWNDLLKKSAPLVAQLGAQVWNQGGANPMGGAIGGVIAQAIQGQQMDAALKKKISEQISGGGGFQQSPTGKSVVSGDLDLLGLSPAQVSELYGTAMKTREAERKYPLDVMGAVGTLYSHVTSGNLSVAQIPRIQAEAEKLTAEARNLPYKEQREAYKTLFEINKAIAETANLEARTATERGISTKAIASIEAERALTATRQAERTKTDEEIRQLRYGLPTEVMNQKNAMEIAKQMPYDAVTNAEGGVDILNKRTGTLTSARLGTVAPQARVTQLGWSMAASTFINQAKLDIAAKYPGDIQKQQNAFSALLFTLGKEGVTSDVQGAAIRGALSDTNKLKFDASMDIYRDGEGKYSLETMNLMVQDKIGRMGKAPVVPTPPVVGAPVPTKMVDISGIKVPVDTKGNIKKSQLRQALEAAGVKGEVAQDKWISDNFKSTGKK